MIDRYLLRYFLAVVDTGSFSRGAAQVNVTQPTLSVGIAKLERLLGTALFHRTNQRVHLTDAGNRLLVHARRIEAEFSLAARSVADIGTSQLVRLGVISTVPTALLELIVTEYRRYGDAGLIEIVEGRERDLAARLARGRIDLAVTVLRPDPEIRQEALHQERYSLALPQWHRLAGEASVRAEDLAEEIMIVRRHCEALSDVSRHFTERGVRPHFSLRTTNDDKALASVRAGLGITVMPDCYRDPAVSRPQLSGFELTRVIGLQFGSSSIGREEKLAPIVNSVRRAAMVASSAANM